MSDHNRGGGPPARGGRSPRVLLGWDPALTETTQKCGPDRDPRKNPKVSHRGGRPGRGWRTTAGGCDERARLSPQIAWDPPPQGFTWTLEITFAEVQDRKEGISGDKVAAPSPGPELEIYLGRSYSDTLGEYMKTQCPRAGRNYGCLGKGPREAWGARMTVLGGDHDGFGRRS